jgi:hypothetical protein
MMFAHRLIESFKVRERKAINGAIKNKIAFTTISSGVISVPAYSPAINPSIKLAHRALSSFPQWRQVQQSTITLQSLFSNLPKTSPPLD